MKNAFKLSSLLLISVVLFQLSCSDDPAPPVDNTPNPTGKWQLATATLVDGNVGTAVPEPLVILNAVLAGLPESIPVGDVVSTTTVVGGALAGPVCEDVPAGIATFYIDLVADNTITFNCPAEGVISTDPNTWVVVEDPNNAGSYSITLTVVVGGTALPITIVDFEISADGNTFTGRAIGYPMVANILEPIGPTNIQFISTDMVFTALP